MKADELYTAKFHYISDSQLNATVQWNKLIIDKAQIFQLYAISICKACAEQQQKQQQQQHSFNGHLHADIPLTFFEHHPFTPKNSLVTITYNDVNVNTTVFNSDLAAANVICSSNVTYRHNPTPKKCYLAQNNQLALYYNMKYVNIYAVSTD